MQRHVFMSLIYDIYMTSIGDESSERAELTKQLNVNLASREII